MDTYSNDSINIPDSPDHATNSFMLIY